MSGWKRVRVLSLVTALSTAVTVAGCPEEPVGSDQGGAPEAPPLGAPGQPPGGPGGEGGPAAAGGGPGEAPPAGEPGAPGAAPAAAPAQGEAGAPPPGGGQNPAGMRLEDIPKVVLTQQAIKSAGNAITVKGVLKGDACKGKKVRIDAMEATTGNPPLRILAAHLVQDIGQYEMLLPRGDGQIWLIATCDVNGDGLISANVDHTGAYSGNPLKPSADVTGAVITLGKEPVQIGTPPPGTRGGEPTGGAGAAPAGQPPAEPAPAAGSQPGAAAPAGAPATGDPSGAAAPAGSPDSGKRTGAAGTGTTKTGSTTAKPTSATPAPKK